MASDRGACSANRIEWIDVAKGIAICLVIVGHTVQRGEGTQDIVRGLIFSFHMPLFIILSAITTKASENASQLIERTEKSFKQLVIPAIAVFILISAVELLRYGATMGIREYLVGKINTFIYASGVDVQPINVKALGRLWFLIALFAGRTIFEYLQYKLKRNALIITCIIMAATGIVVGGVQKLPLSMDVVFAIMPFFLIRFPDVFLIGYMAKGKSGGVPWQAAVATGMAWLILFVVIYKQSGHYLELATREYPMNVLSYACAICGTLMVAGISNVFIKISALKKAFMILGRHTMSIYLVHAADVTIPFLYADYAVGVKVLIRLLLDISLALIIARTIEYIKKRIINSKQHIQDI